MKSKIFLIAMLNIIIIIGALGVYQAIAIHRQDAEKIAKLQKQHVLKSYQIIRRNVFPDCDHVVLEGCDMKICEKILLPIRDARPRHPGDRRGGPGTTMK